MVQIVDDSSNLNEEIQSITDINPPPSYSGSDSSSYHSSPNYQLSVANDVLPTYEADNVVLLDELSIALNKHRLTIYEFSLYLLLTIVIYLTLLPMFANRIAEMSVISKYLVPSSCYEDINTEKLCVVMNVVIKNNNNTKYCFEYDNEDYSIESVVQCWWNPCTSFLNTTSYIYQNIIYHCKGTMLNRVPIIFLDNYFTQILPSVILLILLFFCCFCTLSAVIFSHSY
jgi:hypothetical protein